MMRHALTAVAVLPLLFGCSHVVTPIITDVYQDEDGKVIARRCLLKETQFWYNTTAVFTSECKERQVKGPPARRRYKADDARDDDQD